MSDGYAYQDHIDRDSPIPLYLQVSADMSRRIAEEEWRVGDQIMPENTLAELYQISRITTRQALAQLEKEGLISRKRGERSVVQARPQYIIQELRFPTPEGALQTPIVNPAGQITSTNIRITDLTSPDRRAARMLDLPEDAPLVYLERYFENCGKIVGVNRAWFPKERFPDLAERGLVRESISATLREVYHYDTEAVENFIAAITLDARYARILHVPYASPALRIDSVHFCGRHIPLEFASTIWNGANSQFRLMVSK
ncbi:MAG: GntR family transcriptional regulator [Oscillospiraceae bacterium]|nr:GntR family transcriptional regulator [Oscillospiraceae bacterium]